jgi:hypothetical protein
MWIALPVRKAEDTCKKESSPRPKTLIQLLTLLRLEVWNVQPRRSTCVCFVVPPISDSLGFAGTLSTTHGTQTRWYITFLLGLTGWAR